MALRENFLTPKVLKNVTNLPLNHRNTTALTPSKTIFTSKLKENEQKLKRRSPRKLLESTQLDKLFSLNQIFDDFIKEDIQIDKENFFVFGSGSFGVVIQACYKDKPVSIKVSKNVNKIFGEFNILKMNHRNLVKVLEYVQNPSYSIIIMEEYSKCINLELFLRNNGVDFKTKLKFGLDICNGLNYCHFMNILHLDIKANNVLVTKEMICKLCDFGSSIKLENISDNLVYKTTITHTAPEILLGKRATPKCDIYALGITFWEIQYNSTPYSGIENDVIIYNVVKNNWRPKICVLLNEPLLPYVTCWLKNPQDRPSASMLLETLMEIYKKFF